MTSLAVAAPALAATGSPVGRADDREHLRSLTIMSRFAGIGYLIYFLISVPQLNQPPGIVAGWFTPVGLLFAFGPGFLLLLTALLPGGARWLPPVAYACGVGYLIAGGLWFAAWTGDLTQTETVTWLKSFAGLPGITVALIRLRPAVLVLVISSILAGLITFVGREADHGVAALLNECLWSAVFSLPIMLATRRLVDTGRILDLSRADTLRRAADAASANARNAERARIDALIHDRVIATLDSVHLGDPQLPRHARAALDELAILSDDDVNETTLGVAESLARLRAAAVEVNGKVHVDSRIPSGLDTDEPRYPAIAVRALAEAVGEAVRNTVRHAGEGASSLVLAEPSADALRVTIIDDGCGFDLDEVPPERLGLEVSIRARLTELPGGSADIWSVPGQGTTVRIGWAAA